MRTIPRRHQQPQPAGRGHGGFTTGPWQAAIIGLACFTFTGGESARAQGAASNGQAPAQMAAAGGNVTELPPVVVTSPSPVIKQKAKPKALKATSPAKPSKPKTGNVPAAALTEPPEPSAAAASSSVTPPPGTLVTSEDAFVPVTVAGGREILAHQGATLTNSLMDKPGISGSTFAAGASRPVIRGLDNYRVRVQEDGIGSHDVSALSEDHAVPIDPFAADRIEVVRGPATLRYGSQAIGGAVTVENERIPTHIPEHGVTAVTLGGLSSGDKGADSAFKATAGAEGVAVHADAFKRDAGDYHTPRGREANTFVNSEGASGGISRIWNTGYLGIAYVRLDSLYGIPGEEEAAQRSRIDLNQDKMLAKGEWRPGQGGIDALRFWFGASDYRHDEIFTDEETGAAVTGSRFKNTEQEGRAEIQHLPMGTLLGELHGAAGLHWDKRRTRGQSFEGDSLLEPARTETVAGFLFEELEAVPQLRFQAAVRYEEANISGAGRANPLNADSPLLALGRRYHPLSASLGVLYELPLGIVARLSGQYVERAPDAAELFSKGLHEATRTFEIGNPDLEREKARTLELGFKRAKGDFRFDASFYYSRFDGFIFKRLTGVKCGDTLESCGEEEDLDQVLFSQRDAVFYGTEVGAQWDVAPIWGGIWGLDGQFDIVRAEFTDDENVPRIPPWRLGGGLFYRGNGLFLRAGVLHAFPQSRIAAEEVETPGYTLVNAEASYTWALPSTTGIGPSMTVGVRGENLADDEVLNHTSFKRREEVLLPGASVRLFGTLKLN